jgi:hypothetical protein
MLFRLDVGMYPVCLASLAFSVEAKLCEASRPSLVSLDLNSFGFDVELAYTMHDSCGAFCFLVRQIGAVLHRLSLQRRLPRETMPSL